jgi:predicted dehydrogenase
MSRPFHWGIIGLGRIARKFADDLRLLPHARLHAVASTSAERARQFADDYDAPHAFGSYEAITECPDLDAVYVATPHVLHAECALLCIRRGIAVLSEKPFAMHHAEALAMAEAARTQRVFLMEAIWSFFIPGFQKALEVAHSGSIGRVHTVRADFGFKAPFDPDWRLFDKKKGGGSLLDIGIYPALLSLAVLGKPHPDDIDAFGIMAPTGVDETAVFNWRYPDGRIAMGYSTVAATTPTEAQIYGEEGQIRLHSRFHHPQSITVSHYEGRDMRHETHELPYEGWGYHFEAQHVMDCLAEGRTESPVIPLDFSLDLTATLDAIRAKMGLTYDEV